VDMGTERAMTLGWDISIRNVRRQPFHIQPRAIGLPTFMGNDLETLRDAARQNLGLFTTFPFFQRLFRASGFADEATQMEQGAGPAALSDRLLDAVCLLGPEARYSEQLAAFRAAGVDLPILLPPAGVEGARAVIQAFRR
jgi:hypothetical protein